MTDILEHWDEWMSKFPEERKDVYFSEEYVRLYENEQEKTECFVYEDGDKVLLFPYLLRGFEFNGKHYFDFETPYGYGGPISNSEDKSFVETALRAFVGECKKRNYVAGFVRFCPWLKNYELFQGLFPVIMDRHTVAIDLSLPIEDVWKEEIHSKNRNMIKKAEKEGLTFEADYEFKYLNEFISLYNATMDKLNATGFYYFDDTYYKNLEAKIPNKFLGVTKYNGQIISAAIFMYSGIYGHYHLSGSDRSMLNLSPNNFMLWNAAKELQRKGVKLFHLGGGTTSSEEDSLFKFKHRFSKSLYDFCLGKMVFNPELYSEICADWESKNPDKAEQYKHFLLKYKY